MTTRRRAIRSVGATIAGSEDFTEALIRIRTGQDLCQPRICTIRFEQQTLFSTSMRLPANLHEGDCRARFFLTRKGQVVDMFETAIDVRKVGLERFLIRLLRENPLVYGIMSPAITIMADWGASAAFRTFRTQASRPLVGTLPKARRPCHMRPSPMAASAGRSQPRPTYGILVAITVMNWTFASSGSSHMCSTDRAT